MRPLSDGETLVEPGAAAVPFFVLRSGRVHVLLRLTPDGEQIVVTHGPGAFTGEANRLLGRPPMTRMRVLEAGEAVELTREQMLSLVQNDTEIGDIVMRAYMFRRSGARSRRDSATSSCSARRTAPGRCASRSS